MDKVMHAFIKRHAVSGLLILLALLALLAAAKAIAAPAAPPPEALKRVEDYLNSLTTIVADFSQVAPDGALTGGKFFLKRPGKMRWQYEPPTPVLMVVNGSSMVYYDYELEQVSHIPIDSTLGSFLAQEVIRLDDSFVKIEAFKQTPGMVRLTLTQANKPEAGKLTLEFSDSPLRIRNMVVTDAQGQTTTIALNNARFGQKLDDKLFIFKDPRQQKR